MARVISGAGYYMVTPPEGYRGKTYIGGRYVYEHRLLMEQKLGRLLLKEEIIDHINNHKLDNRIENLQILDIVTHGKKDVQYGKPNVSCTQCSHKFHLRPSMIKRGTGTRFCSRVCYIEFVQDNNWSKK